MKTRVRKVQLENYDEIIIELKNLPSTSTSFIMSSTIENIKFKIEKMAKNQMAYDIKVESYSHPHPNLHPSIAKRLLNLMP